MFSIWTYLVAALAIAVTAFVIGQIVPGLGVAFAAAASTGWTAYSSVRQQRLRRSC